MPIYKLYVPNMVCPACEAPVTILKGWGTAEPDYPDHTITLTTKNLLTPNEIEKFKSDLDDIGFTCEGIVDLTTVENSEKKQTDFEAKKNGLTKQRIRSYWIKGIIGALSGTALLALSIFGVGIPLIGMMAIGGISTLMTFYFGKETYQNAALSLFKAKTFSMDSLFTISTLLAIGASFAAFFIPGLPMMFEAALLILGFKNIGKAIEESAKNEITQHSFRAKIPAKILRVTEKNLTEEIPVKHLLPMNVIIVKKGQTVPVDGICLDEVKSIYKTVVTGRTIPEIVRKNEFIHAGCIVPDDVEHITIQVKHTEADSHLAFLDKRIKLANSEKSAIEEKAAKILKYFIPTIFGIAIVAGVCIGIFFPPIAAIQCAIAILVSACPCTLGLVTPLAIKTGMTKAAAKGISFKNGKSIEAANQVDTVVFDLNGTLTTGILKVIGSKIPSDIWQQIAKIEAESKHPIAQAIHQLASSKISTSPEFKKFKVDPPHHAGISAECDNDHFVIGNSEMMQAHKISTLKFAVELKQTSAEHIIYVAKNKEVIGYVLLEDPLRKDAIATINELKNQNKAVYICTGADEITAKKYALKLGIPEQNIFAKCIGDSADPKAITKTQCITKLKKQGRRPAMFGDAANDAVAVASCDFGVAMASEFGHQETQANAAAVINQDSLWSIVNAFAIAKQTVNNITQNLGISVTYNLASFVAFSGLLMAIGFALNPALGAALMVLQTGLILLNLARFKRQATPALPKCELIKGKDNSGLQSTYAHLSQTRLDNQLNFERAPTAVNAAETKSIAPENFVVGKELPISQHARKLKF